jgi:hypothetical protein
MSKSVWVREEAHRTMVDIHQVDHPLKPAARASYPPKNNLKIHRRSMTEPQGQLSQAGVSAFVLLSNVVDNVVGALGFVVRLNGPDKCYAINGIPARPRWRSCDCEDRSADKRRKEKTCKYGFKDR